MTPPDSGPDGATLSPDDRALPFHVAALDVRGRTVTLGPAIDAILDRHRYPRAVNLLLGEAMTLAALLATSLKNIGRFILQTQTDGPVRMLVVDIRTPGQMRANATFDADAVAALDESGRDARQALLGRGTLAMTVEQGKDDRRYQGFVPIDGDSLETAAHTYFRQSEQIPTRVRLATAEMFAREADGTARRRWRAGGLIAQFLPEASERVRQRDLPPGDPPPGTDPLVDDIEEDDAWAEASALVGTVEDHELTDPDITAERLLYRLFHERGVRVFKPIELLDRCSCSRERILTVLNELDADEIDKAAVDGAIEVRCEFCGTPYHIGRDELAHHRREGGSAPN